MKRIHLTKSYYASLTWYALSLLGLTGHEPDSRYEGWVEKIAHLGKDFGFKPPVAGGPMFQLLYQIPSYLNPENQQALAEVKQCIMSWIQTSSLRCFQEMWPQKTVSWENWYTFVIEDEKKAAELVEVFFQLINQLWQDYKGEYTQKIEKFSFGVYEKRVNVADIFKRWTKVLGVGYPYDWFKIIICPEISSLASSVGPDMIVFGSSCDHEEIVPSTIHEIGVRYSNLAYLRQHEKTAKIISTDYVNLLRLIEAETCYQKMKIFPEIETDKFLSPSWAGIVHWRENQEIEFENYYDHLANLYQKAKQAGVI